jgi:hypothetical protein
MTYIVACIDCDFEAATDDWITAHEYARDHEAAFADHWVELCDPN